MNKYKSCAQWPKGTFDGQNNYTEDYHEEYDQAYAVCEMLEKMGAGGERKDFPIKTWVDFTDEEKANQDKLRFENIQWRLKHGSYSQYKDTQSVGCVVYWLKAYGADNCYEHIQVGDGKVYLWNKLIGTFVWQDLQPIFTFQLSDDNDGGYTRGIVKNLENTQQFYLDTIKDRIPLEEYNNLCDVAKLGKGFGQKKIKYASDEQAREASEKVIKQFWEVFKKLADE